MNLNYYFLQTKRNPITPNEQRPTIELCDLPKCKHCNGLLRPHIVWFGEHLDANVLSKARKLEIYDFTKHTTFALILRRTARKM